MKYISIIVLSCFFFLTSCSVDNNNVTDDLPKEIEVYQWHLLNVSVGFAGVDIDYAMETIIWVFNVDFNNNGSIQVQNNNTDDTLEDGLNSGTYAISIPAQNNKSYLFIESNEFGEVLTTTNEDLIIDQNSMSSGTGADGFIYTFKRKIVIISVDN
jgi:hypothetical protein